MFENAETVHRAFAAISAAPTGLQKAMRRWPGGVWQSSWI